ncbi:hypothetical protein D9M72_548520 [compost metagenome]
MRSSIHGIKRRPISSITATKAATLPSVENTASRTSPVPGLPSAPVSAAPARSPAIAGSSTSASTMARSSTISQPTAIRPWGDSTRSRSCNALSSTTVLATDSASPYTSPCPHDQPKPHATSMPRKVAIPICTTAPGIAMRFTAIRSLIEKCSPTPNISRITPSSASSGASAWSAV